mgnify:CR=1 FL=1
MMKEDDQIAEELKKNYMGLKEQVYYLSHKIFLPLDSCHTKPEVFFGSGT